MTKENRQKIHTALLLEREKTEIKIEDLRELTKPISPENAIGRISRMDAINNKSINEAALRTTESRFRNLNLALERIQEKDFGLCIVCGTEIALGRLLIMPGSSKCINCASRT